MTELINAVLDISKLDTGAWAVSPASFPVVPLLTRLADEYGPEAAACGLTMRVVPSSAFVHTDRALFQRAMSNLVSNAIRYTRSGKILIGCRRRQGWISVEVWDTGIGIPDSMRPISSTISARWRLRRAATRKGSAWASGSSNGSSAFWGWRSRSAPAMEAGPASRCAYPAAIPNTPRRRRKPRGRR